MCLQIPKPPLCKAWGLMIMICDALYLQYSISEEPWGEGDYQSEDHIPKRTTVCLIWVVRQRAGRQSTRLSLILSTQSIPGVVPQRCAHLVDSSIYSFSYYPLLWPKARFDVEPGGMREWVPLQGGSNFTCKSLQTSQISELGRHSLDPLLDCPLSISLPSLPFDRV